MLSYCHCSGLLTALLLPFATTVDLCMETALDNVKIRKSRHTHMMIPIS